MSALLEDIARFIESGTDDLDGFDTLARALFARQYARNAPYRNLCDSQGIIPGKISRWREIPAAPAAAFKRFALSCADVSECTVFHSSGTTGAETSRHYMDADALDIYRLALRSGYERAIGNIAPFGIAAVMAPPGDAPHSSLSFMLGELVGKFGMQFFWGADLARDLRKELRCTPYPFVLFGTALALVGFLDDSTGETFPLPEGSVIVETGGFKGLRREISRAELYEMLSGRFEIAPDRCFSEYGMSEMSSQFYSQGPAGLKFGPPWVRTRAIDPVTNEDALPGQPGLLRHYDLANFNSAFAVQTEDLGIVHPDRSFELLGRAPGAVLRGCSLTAG